MLGLLGLLLISCSKKTATTTVSIQMKNIEPVRTQLNDREDMNEELEAETRSTIRTFTPTVFKFPIKKITLIGSGGLESSTIYECSGTTAENCLVDLADPTAVANLIPNPVTVRYEEGGSPVITGFQVQVDPTCDSGSMTPFDIKVKGSYSITGTSYYTTNSQATLFSTNAGDNEEVGVSSSTCTMTWNLPSPAAVTGSNVTISLFVTVSDIAYGDYSASNSAPTCKSKSTSSVCVPGYAVPYPYVGTGDATLSTFTLTQAGVGKARVHAAMLNSSSPVGAFTRPYFDGSFAQTSNCYSASWLDSLVANGDNTYQFNIAEGGYTWQLFSAFNLVSASPGTCKDRFTSTTYSYTAVKE